MDHIDCCDGVIPILDPVDLATGSFWLHETDLARPGRAGLDFFVTRHYHSGNVLNGPLGKRWDSPLFMRVVTEAGATPATFYNGRMRAGFHFQVVTAGPDLVEYASPDNGYFKLTKVVVGAGAWQFRLQDVSGRTMIFEPGAVVGTDHWFRLKSMEDPNGNRIEIAYDAPSGYPTSVTDSMERTHLLAWYAIGAASGKLKTVTAADGAVVRYSYDASGRLRKVTLPPTAEHPAGSDRLYEYDAQDRLVSITEPGQTEPYVFNVYDGLGRVVQQRFGSATETSHVDYGDYPLVKVTNPVGDVIEYLLDAAGTKQVLQVRVNSDTEPGTAWVTSYEYDDRGATTRITQPDGRVTAFVFDSESPDPLKRHNLLRRTVTGTDDTTAVDVWTFTDNQRIASHHGPRAVAMDKETDPAWGTRFSYDSTGNLIAVLLPAAPDETSPVDAIQWEFDTHGQMTRRIEPDGKTTVWEYDPLADHPGPVRQIENPAPDEIVSHFAYDLRGDVAHVSSTCGCSGASSETWSEWNSRRELLAVTTRIDDERLARTEFLRDERGLVLQERVSDDSPMGDGWATTDFIHDVLRRPTLVTTDVDATGTVGVLMEYDAVGRLVREERDGDPVKSWEYDSRGMLTAVAIEDGVGGELRVEYAYDANGQLVARRDAKGNWHQVERDGLGRIVAETDVLGRRWETEWSPDGRPLRSRLRSAGGQIVSERTAEWDLQGRLVRSAVLALDASGSPLDDDGWIWTEYEYDPSSRLRSVSVEGGPGQRIEHDAFGRVVSVRESVEPANGIEIGYGPDGRPRQLRAVEVDSVTGAVGVRTVVANVDYDAAGRIRTLTGALGEVTAFEWNLAGQLTRSVSPEGRAREFRYDELGRRISERRLRGMAGQTSSNDALTTFVHSGFGTLERMEAAVDGAAAQVTAFEYDGWRALRRVTHPDGSVSEVTALDAFLEATETVDRNGTVFAIARDALGRVTAVQADPAPGVVGSTERLFEYDAAGRMTRAENEDSVVERIFDSLGGLQAETVTSTATGLTRTTKAVRDHLGRVTQLHHPGHAPGSEDALVIEYDGSGRVSEMRRQLGSTVRAVASYDRVGSRIVARHGAGTSVAYGHDAAGRLVALSASRGGSPVMNALLGYDADGQVTDAWRGHFGTSGQLLPPTVHDRFAKYEYDGLRQMTLAATGLSAGAWESGNFQEAGLLSELSYDGVWNRTTVAAGPGSSQPAVVEYEAGDANEYETVTGHGQPAWDTAGRLLDNNVAWIADYDAWGFPVTVSIGGTHSRMRHDALGRKLEVADLSGDGVDRMTWWGWQELERERTGGAGAERWQFVHDVGLDRLLELRDAGSGVTWHALTDERGGPAALVDDSGGLVASWRYSPFGERLHVSPVDGQPAGASAGPAMPAGFQGRWILPGGERFLDFRFRTYDTAWGRFLQPDPLGHPDGRSNRYQFGGNDPFRSDPFGLLDDGDPNKDTKDHWTHVGVTMAANELGGEKLLSADALKTVYTSNWLMDNSPHVAGLGSLNNILFHDLGTDENVRRAVTRKWELHLETDCSLETLGVWLHFKQDSIAHRDPKDKPYNWIEGHAVEQGLSYLGLDFNPDMVNPKHMKWWEWGNLPWAEFQRDRVGKIIVKTREEINKYLDRCGQSGHDGLFADEGRAQPVEDTTRPKGPTTGSGGTAGGGAGANPEGAKPAAAATTGAGGNRALTGRGTYSPPSGPTSGAGGQMQRVTSRPDRSLTGTGKGMCLPDCEGPPPPAPPPTVDPPPSPTTTSGSGVLTGRGRRGGT